MDDRIPALVFGACLVVGGSLGLVWHTKSWRKHRAESAPGDADRLYYRRQFARRIQATSLIVLIGILLPVGDSLIPWQKYPSGFALYWIAVLGLALWVLLLGCGDLLSTRVHTRDAVTRLRALREHQRELEREIARLRANRN